MKILNAVIGATALAALSLFSASANAAGYPERQITMIVPFAAGGPTDTVARLVAESMSKDLGQQVIVENVGGAGGTLGAARVANADADGYTVLLHHIGMATSASLYRKLPYDTLNAFDYVGLVTDVPMTLLARKDMPASDLKGLIEYAKANSDKVTVANAGIGAASHLCGMLFMSSIKTSLVTVPYKGTGPAMTDLLGGQVDIMCDQTTNTTKQIQGGTVKAYAVTSPERLGVLKDIPTVKEAGLPDMQVGIWHGLYAPKGTPKDALDKLNKALKSALKNPNVAARFAELGTVPSPDNDVTPAALKAKLEGEIARWKPVIQAAGQYAD
ncbi:tripartite tricarboxylate transporter substrate-binding protein [Neorhizobium galegae]|uniref:Extra-cytoplasmic solute receptor n=2 Tax=Neorhizobium galegae TaxID=399 RepID=A0A068SWR7_NEOGA|nr:tripartite tricarboxylate transporter substrate-binding protein [Neorhizobium galegae]KAB1088161.1 tripartite tricarboxylate transporter substrate binding protein BugD [Neorhizobium galegae]MCQ1850755.1 tripartite tricarboxylate transporter substrate-binding protein [Neorhizobium galegae]CDN49500.1 Extra-cytoplasmic solute receptor [Neorhizobium galegae bv. orientalis str. HAMBI 540]CDZ47023.1 Extra-cytoplasmic solute receptor [Neorhizobium galegae bv. orientalis]